MSCFIHIKDQDVHKTYQLFKNINQDLHIPGKGLASITLIFAITPNPTARSRNRLQVKYTESNTSKK